jgi:hypothetical protein
VDGVGGEPQADEERDMSDSGGQDEPVEEGHDDATAEDRIAGIVEQTRADIGSGHVADARDTLGQRLHEAEIWVTEDEFEAILARVTS